MRLMARAGRKIQLEDGSAVDTTTVSDMSQRRISVAPVDPTLGKSMLKALAQVRN